MPSTRGPLHRQVIASALALLVLGSFPVGAVADRGTPPVQGTPRVSTAAGTPAPSPDFQVERTEILRNGTVLDGNVVPLQGLGPGPIADDWVDHRIYVADSGNDVLTEVDASEGTVLHEIPLPFSEGAVPSAMAYFPVIDQILVTSSTTDQLAIVSTVSNRTVHLFTVGADPSGVAVDAADGLAFVSNVGSDNVSLYYGNLGQLLNYSEPVGQGPSAVCYDNASEQLVVANAGSDNLTVFDSQNLSNRSSVAAGNMPTALALDATNRELLVVDRGADAVLRLNATTWTSRGSFPVGDTPSSVATDANGTSYTVNQGTDNLSIVDDASGQPLGSIPYPSPLSVVTFDAFTDRVFASDPGGDDLSLVAPTGHRAIGSFDLATTPIALASNGGTEEVGVADAMAVDRFPASGGRLEGTTPLGDVPAALLADPAQSAVFVDGAPAAGGSGNVTELAAGNGSEEGSTRVPDDPVGMALDPSSGNLYVAETGGPAISEVGIGSFAGVATDVWDRASWGGDPVDLAVDPSTGYLYVTEGTTGSELVVLNFSSAAIQTQIAIGRGATAILYDPADGLFWTAVAGLDTVEAIDPANQSVVATVPVDSDPVALTLLANATVLAVADAGANEVQFLDPGSASVLETLAVGGSPEALGVGAANDTLFVADTTSGTISQVAPSNASSAYPVQFEESGLPVAATWNLSFDGVPYASNYPLFGLQEPNGTYAYRIDPTDGYSPNVTSGSVVVDGQGVNVSIAFTAPTFPVVFNETGLPDGTWWDVVVGPRLLEGTTSELSTVLPNGSYAFSVTTGASYRASPAMGTVRVRGTLAAQPVTFVASGPYDLTFEESGLAADTNWSVNVSGTLATAGGPTIVVPVPNGSYAYRILPAGHRFPVPAVGVVTVAGRSPPVVAVEFGPLRYAVTFLETGLSDGANWTVQLDGATASSTGTALVLSAPNGTFPVQVTAPPEWALASGGDVVLVNGSAITIDLHFSGVPGTTGLLGGMVAELAVGAAILGAAVVLGVVLLRRRPPGSRVRRLSGELVLPEERSAGPAEPVERD